MWIVYVEYDNGKSHEMLAVHDESVAAEEAEKLKSEPGIANAWYEREVD